MDVFRSAVVMATTAPRGALLRRAIASLLAQYRPLERLVLVLDGPGRSEDLDALIDPLRAGGTTVDVVRNRRTPGASGSWNTALDHLLRHASDPEHVVVSVLDDDDWWEAGYLAAALASFADADVAGGTLVRHDALAPDGRVIEPPLTIEASAFLVGNSGLQPSNLSACLSTLLHAGGFDEALASCTDRDLCIRLSDLGARYAAAPGAIAHHDTLHGLERLSDPANPKRAGGLNAFRVKYRQRMTAEELAACDERAKRFFPGWQPETDQPRPRQQPTPAIVPATAGAVRFIVGAIVDGDKPERALPLIADLARLARHHALDSFDVVLLENGAAAGFEHVVRDAESRGLRVWSADVDAQRRAAPALGLLDSDFTLSKTIAVARTLLQRFVHAVASTRHGAVAWILDDDARISEADGGFDTVFATIVRAREGGHGVVIGMTTGAPPVPRSSTLRVQLVDLVHLLAAASKRSPDEPAPDPADNERWTRGRRDYYYDLARDETDRLETPFVPPAGAGTFGELVRDVVSRARRILAGELVTRSVPSALAHPWTTTHLRGGNTLVLDVDVLRDVPNLSPRVAGRCVRRSDMIWALHADAKCGRSVVQAPLAVVHDRSSEREEAETPRKLVEDILGYAFFRAYEKSVDQGPSDAAAVRHDAGKYATERLAAFRLSFWRSLGLVRVLRRLLGQPSWWSSDAAIRAQLEHFVVELERVLVPARLDAVEHGVREGIDVLGVEEYLAQCQSIGAALAGTDPTFDDWVVERRIRFARQVVDGRGDFVGAGAEGVVLRVGSSAYKVFDAWSARERTEHVPTLRRLVEKGCEALPRVLSVREDAAMLVAETEYVEGETYRGGHGAELLAMLRALHAAGLVHTNVHPKNMRVARDGRLVLVDVGRSVLPRGSAIDEEFMVRRAWLCWRFAFRSDLDELLRLALTTEDFAELAGWRSLLDAVREPPAKQRLDEAIGDAIDAAQVARVVDFGAGKPRRLHLDRDLLEWLAFDVDATLAERWRQQAPGATFVSSVDALEPRPRVDAVVCELVLCALGDAHVRDALARIRRIIRDEGRVWIAICDPTSVHVAQTADAWRHASDVSYDETRAYAKTVLATSGDRVEVHRPLDAYRRAFARGGFAVARETMIDGTDTQRLERVPEFRLFELRPLAQPPCSTSLLIKVCALDAQTARWQIEHLVGALATPRAFDEVVVALDPKESGFPRAHGPGDPELLRRELDRLLGRGVIDRVVHGPQDGEAARAIARRWFARDDVQAAHCANGQPALGILDAIEGCTGDLVLHADVDVLVGRTDPTVDLARDAFDVFQRNPGAVALSLSVFGDDAPSVRTHDERGPFRLDATCGWIHRERLLALRPLQNSARDGVLALPWHRCVDRDVRAGRATSLRRGSGALFFVVPDNARKNDPDAHLLVLDRVESGFAPAEQRGRADAVGSLERWLGPKRNEPVVVFIAGRNVGPGRIRRCFDSLRAQTLEDWGAIVLDDGSTSGAQEVLREECRSFGARATLVLRRRRVGPLPNLVLAVNRLVARPDAVVVLVDLDDALGSRGALERVAQLHTEGADVTVGSMVRTDKEARYVVDFSDPRGRRGGAVWQHLRTFRRSLFDRIDDADLMHDGSYFDLAGDWAYMLPIVEMAERPAWIRDALYLHEPSTSRDDDERRARERAVGVIVKKPSYRGRDHRPRLTVLAYHRVADGDDPLLRLYRQRGMLVSRSAFEAQLRAAARHFEPVRLSDVLRAFRGESTLPPRALLVTFDDGYGDLEAAVPLALKLGFPVGLFVRAARADGYPSWAPLDLLYCVRARNGGVVTAEERDLLLRWPLSDQLGYAASEAAGMADDRRSTLYAHEGALRELAGPDVEVGSHGVEHVRWTRLGEQGLREQLSLSRAWLARFGAAFVNAASYPDGDVDARAAGCLAAEGFDVGFSIGALRAPGVAPRFAIERHTAEDDPIWIERLLSKREAAA